MKANLTTILLIAATAMIAVPTASANPCTWCRVSHSSGYCAPLCNRRLVQKTKLPIIPSWDEEDDEEAGGFSAEAGYEKDGYNAKIKWEQDQDQMDDEDVVRRLRAPRRLSFACNYCRSYHRSNSQQFCPGC